MQACSSGTGGQAVHLAAAAMEALQVAEAVRHTAQQVRHQAVVAGKGAGHDVAVHDDVADGAGRQAQACHDPIAHQRNAIRGGVLHSGTRSGWRVVTGKLRMGCEPPRFCSSSVGYRALLACNAADTRAGTMGSMHAHDRHVI